MNRRDRRRAAKNRRREQHRRDREQRRSAPHGHGHGHGCCITRIVERIMACPALCAALTADDDHGDALLGQADANGAEWFLQPLAADVWRPGAPEMFLIVAEAKAGFPPPQAGVPLSPMALTGLIVDLYGRGARQGLVSKGWARGGRG